MHAPADNFRKYWDVDSWIEHTQFLPNINNLRSVNPIYKEKLNNLTNFGMYMWEQDKTVYPHESEWFSILDEQGHLVALRDQVPFYSEDQLGLRELEENGKLFFYKGDGDHMHLTQSIIDDYLVPLLYNDR